MAQHKTLTTLLGLQGWMVARDGVRYEGEAVVVRIRPAAPGYACPTCRQGVLWAYDHTERQVRDFPLWGRRCTLLFAHARLDCPTCGAVTAHLPWLDPRQRQTLRYERRVARLCEVLPVTQVAALEALDKGTVYRIDKKWLALRLAAKLPREVQHLGLDEIAVTRGHRYFTLFYDLAAREVIGLVKGRKQRPVSGWLRRWGKPRCRAVTAVCLDLWAPYRASLRINCPKAAVVFDKYHVYRYLADAVEQVRRTEQNKATQEGKELLKGSRWLWLKKECRLKPGERVTLQELRDLNAHLATAHTLKEDFANFYACADAEAAQAFLTDWCARCTESKLKPFTALAKRLTKWADGICAFFTHRITNGVAEGLNNKIKVLKRRSYGFHDEEYFMLKIFGIAGGLPSVEHLPHSV